MVAAALIDLAPAPHQGIGILSNGNPNAAAV
jgi:hypothetical protein